MACCNLVSGDCVVGHCHLYPLHSWQDILLTFAEMELDSTAMFPPGTSVMFIRSTGEPVLAQVVGHSEHGDAYRRITYDRDGKTVLHDRASVWCLSLLRAPSPPRVYGGGAVPQGGVGDRHLVTVPQGVMGDRLPWGGERQGGGGVLFLASSARAFSLLRRAFPAALPAACGSNTWPARHAVAYRDHHGHAYFSPSLVRRGVVTLTQLRSLGNFPGCLPPTWEPRYRIALVPASSTGTGGRPGPVLVCDTPQPPAPPGF